ncbi:hypothetical protein [Flavobacterium sp.]|uniref:hypothetical protein n=1 Tax=Flavobacterium sp. TaxID=239 RepID=UPI00286E2D98|nr:hypothetical protein [Flavobacterium sp.]
MIFRAQAQFTQTLLNLPETGMGYQIIDARKSGRYATERFVVYNGELIVELDSNFNAYKRQIVLNSYTKTFSASNFIALENPVLVKKDLIRSVRTFSAMNMMTKDRNQGTTGAVDNQPIYANGTDVFVRLSAYEDDRRIDFINKKLKNGTFTTTEKDYLACKNTNDDPVDRYALPNDEIIKWAFYIRPTSSDKYRPGVVQPANNHNGGGIEALFDNGTSNNTYFKKTVY